MKSLTRVFEFSTDWHYHFTLKMAYPQVVETSVTNDSPSQDFNHPDDHFQSRARGGGTPISNRRGCSSEILNSTPKGDHLGVA